MWLHLNLAHFPGYRIRPLMDPLDGMPPRHRTHPHRPPPHPYKPYALFLLPPSRLFPSRTIQLLSPTLLPALSLLRPPRHRNLHHLPRRPQTRSHLKRPTTSIALRSHTGREQSYGSGFRGEGKYREMADSPERNESPGGAGGGRGEGVCI